MTTHSLLSQIGLSIVFMIGATGTAYAVGSDAEFQKWRKQQCLNSDRFWARGPGRPVRLGSLNNGKQRFVAGNPRNKKGEAIPGSPSPSSWSKEVSSGQKAPAGPMGGDYEGGGGTGICITFDREGNPLWDDGASKLHPLDWIPVDLLIGLPPGFFLPAPTTFGYPRLFYNAGVRHDYCYHHNPKTYGYSKGDCDKLFLGDMTKSCKHKFKWWNPERELCKRVATNYYLAVVAFGGDAFLRSNTIGRYREPRLDNPRKLVLMEIPEDLREDAEDPEGFVGNRAVQALLKGDLHETRFWLALFADVEFEAQRLQRGTSSGTGVLFYRRQGFDDVWGFVSPKPGFHNSVCYLTKKSTNAAGVWQYTSFWNPVVCVAEGDCKPIAVKQGPCDLDFRKELFASWDYLHLHIAAERAFETRSFAYQQAQAGILHVLGE